MSYDRTNKQSDKQRLQLYIYRYKIVICFCLLGSLIITNKPLDRIDLNFERGAW